MRFDIDYRDREIKNTYTSRNYTAKLNPEKFAEICARIGGFARLQEEGGEHGNIPGPGYGLIWVNGKVRILKVAAAVMPPASSDLRRVGLAELTLSEDGKDLTLKVNAHEHLLIDPFGLGKIVREYELH